MSLAPRRPTLNLTSNQGDDHARHPRAPAVEQRKTSGYLLSAPTATLSAAAVRQQRLLGGLFVATRHARGRPGHRGDLDGLLRARRAQGREQGGECGRERKLD